MSAKAVFRIVKLEKVPAKAVRKALSNLKGKYVGAAWADKCSISTALP